LHLKPKLFRGSANTIIKSQKLDPGAAERTANADAK
jgi:hypothetical protein